MLILFLLAFFSTSSASANDLPGWQTYCAAEPSNDMKYRVKSQEYITRVLVDGEHSHDMFAFSINGEVRVQDMVSGEQWGLSQGRFVPVPHSDCPSYVANGHTFTFKDGFVKACAHDCTSVRIAEGTFIFAYAAAEQGVVALTNYGGALLFRDGQWCRMTRFRNDVYECPLVGEEPMRFEPRKVQFYSSVRFKGKTLVGEWPTGRLYEFNGKTLRPIHVQPPFVSTAPVGYEAQSMAVFCGDLYVGYWPTGEVWRLDRISSRWSLAASLFPRPSGTEAFIPFEDREKDDQSPRFYGRRVSALVPGDGSLYAVTANLLKWSADYISPILSPEEADHYGAVYRIDRDCKP